MGCCTHLFVQKSQSAAGVPTAGARAFRAARRAARARRARAGDPPRRGAGGARAPAAAALRRCCIARAWRGRRWAPHFSSPVAYHWPLSLAAAGLRAFVVVGRLAALTPSRRSRPRAAAGWCADGPPGGATARGTARLRSRAAGGRPASPHHRVSATLQTWIRRQIIDADKDPWTCALCPFCSPLTPVARTRKVWFAKTWSARNST